MIKNHDFNFDGGKYLRKMCAIWFVFYSFFYFPAMNLKFLETLRNKLKSGNLRSINLNALPGRYVTRLDLYKEISLCN